MASLISHDVHAVAQRSDAMASLPQDSADFPGILIPKKARTLGFDEREWFIYQSKTELYGNSETGNVPNS
jgi:hypothetical protein